jgi:hypothetical protein
MPPKKNTTVAAPVPPKLPVQAIPVVPAVQPLNPAPTAQEAKADKLAKEKAKLDLPYEFEASEIRNKEANPSMDDVAHFDPSWDGGSEAYTIPIKCSRFMAVTAGGRALAPTNIRLTCKQQVLVILQPPKKLTYDRGLVFLELMIPVNGEEIQIPLYNPTTRHVQLEDGEPLGFAVVVKPAPVTITRVTPQVAKKENK